MLAPTTIVLVDDNVDAAQSLALLLQADGHRVQLAHDGMQALEVARGFQPRVVRLDIGLPRMDGYAVARALRGDAWLAAAVIVALSGYGHAEDRERSRDAGFDGHLLKPVETVALYRTVAQLSVGEPLRPGLRQVLSGTAPYSTPPWRA